MFAVKARDDEKAPYTRGDVSVLRRLVRLWLARNLEIGPMAGF